MAAIYTTWRDRGEHVGIRCSICGRTHWKEIEKDDALTDWSTGKPCENCMAIKEEGVFAHENTAHAAEIAKYESDKQALVAESQDPSTAVLHCNHQASQP